MEADGWKLEAKEWEPEEDENFLTMISFGNVSMFNRRGVIDEYYDFAKKIGNVHRTGADAEAYKQRLIDAHRKGII